MYHCPCYHLPPKHFPKAFVILIVTSTCNQHCYFSSLEPVFLSYSVQFLKSVTTFLSDRGIRKLCKWAQKCEKFCFLVPLKSFNFDVFFRSISYPGSYLDSEMGSTQQTAVVDLECGYGGGGGATASNDGESSDFFSDAEEGSCFYSTADGDGFNDEEEIMEEINVSRRVSSVAESECSVCIVQNIIENTGTEIKLHLEKQERDCRICHLSLITKGAESGVPIELGCSCKGDLASAHRHCAETWFKIKGNKICEICNAIASNVVVGENFIDSGQQTNDSSRTTAATSEQSDTSSTDPGRRFFDGRFVNFMLACLVFVFVLSWLFRFNVHS